METTKYLLDESDIPTQWYNVVADMPNPPSPPLGPDGNPVPPEALGAIFPMGLLEQEMSADRWIPIPDEIREVWRLWRPSPLYRARNLEAALGTPAHIYYKYEGGSPPGSHKPNTAVAQAYYNRQAGIRRISTETGAGQWGSALAMAGQLFGIEIRVYMVKISYQQKPYRRAMMEAWGAEVLASPSEISQSGRKILADDPDCPGSLGMAISEAVEEAASREDTNYSLGSVLNHVCLHQTVIGLEAKKQMEMAGEYPDVVIGCCGGGSNFAGLAFPFFADKAAGKEVFVPPGIHAGGLRYHGDSPLLSQLVHEGLIEAAAVPQLATFEAGLTFARTEGIIPAPETNHAIRGAIDEALACKETGEPKVILFNFSGHGHFDMSAYDRYLAGDLQDYDYPEEAIQAALAHLPKLPNS